jgi:NAD(P)H-nitrite reductase large subunit
MPGQLDAGAGQMLERALGRLGIEALAGARVASIEDHAVVLADGAELPAELVVVAAGVRPETSLARAAGIEVERGILVDDELRTSCPCVWAVGECAEHRGTVYGLWAPLARQARAAAAAVCGDPSGFQGSVPATTLKVAGVELFAGGASAAGDGQDEIVWSDGRSGVYRKLVLEGERLAGAVLVGDAGDGRRLSELLRRGGAVPDQLLGPPGSGAEQPTEPDPGDLICSCNAVTRGEIEQAIRAGGLTTVPQVSRATRAATGCGSCAPEVERLIH